jgi:hypothetical protein
VISPPRNARQLQAARGVVELQAACRAVERQQGRCEGKCGASSIGDRDGQNGREESRIGGRGRRPAAREQGGGRTGGRRSMGGAPEERK